MLIALRFNLRVDYNIELPQNKAKTSTAASSKAKASSFKGFGFFKTLNITWFNTSMVVPTRGYRGVTLLRYGHILGPDPVNPRGRSTAEVGQHPRPVNSLVHLTAPLMGPTMC